jgi:hypothetical protein
MAKQTIEIGANANDGSGNKLRIGAQKINSNFTEVYEAIELLQAEMITASSIVRSKLNETCDGNAGQVIGFSSQFANVYALSIIDHEGIGIAVTAQNEDGFTITSLSAGTFGYIAMIEI